MYKIIATDRFRKWLSKLADRRAVARIASRLDRIALGNMGDIKPVGRSISEIRIDYGPGYRIYFIRKGDTVIILLCGGDKSTQQRDIRDAQDMALTQIWKDIR